MGIAIMILGEQSELTEIGPGFVAVEFLSKLIEKVIARRLFAHLQDNGIMEKFLLPIKQNIVRKLHYLECIMM